MILGGITDLNPALVLYGLALAAGLIGHFAVYYLISGLATRMEWSTGKTFIVNCFRPMLWTVILLVLRIMGKLPEYQVLPVEVTGQVFALVLTGLIAWLLIRVVYFLEGCVLSKFDVKVKDNLQARKVHTQFKVFKRIIIIVVIILAFATMLMTFEQIRQLGTMILASAGIAGIVIGLAAQKTLTTFIAGLQIAISQPIREDDVVIVEGEWGRIEEITLTYVVVRIWDLRRLIVPITYFIDKPFQNWTRISADILGTVFLYTDYTIPVDALREELQRILEASDHWDRKVCVLQVTNTTEKSMEIRALMSSADASIAWNLRCEVREKLVDFVRREYPDALPKLRAELEEIKELKSGKDK